MDKELELEEKRQNRLQWFIFVILIPLIAASIFTIVILKAAGIDAGKAARGLGEKIPGIKELVKEEEKPSTKRYETQIASLQGTLKKNEAKISQLESIIDSRDKVINSNEIEKQRLEQEIVEQTRAKDENKKAFKDIIQTYQNMSPGKAAPILSELDENEAVKILSNLSSETLAAILEKMEPAEAASLTQKLTVNVEKKGSGSAQ
ncbi:MotE family protein [Peribacillus sp. SCS-37]|uniref:MotE family protein n=1 Tax=Paraperibacillus esterisolvens TaxID=3115296 RepID=UPI003905D9D4